MTETPDTNRTALDEERTVEEAGPALRQTERGPVAEADATSVTTVNHQSISEWRGRELVDRDGDALGKLEAVYVDIETDEPMFGTLKEGGVFDRHLTFVPLEGITIGPDTLQVAASKNQVKDAPNIESDGHELSDRDELVLYHHYNVDYTPRDSESGRRLVRR